MWEFRKIEKRDWMMFGKLLKNDITLQSNTYRKSYITSNVVNNDNLIFWCRYILSTPNTSESEHGEKMHKQWEFKRKYNIGNN